MSNLKIIDEIIHRVYESHVSNCGGNVAQYIPELSSADPERFGIAVCTVNNEVVSVGDTESLFSLQSITKPFVYGLALECRNKHIVDEFVGSEPSGDPFNSIELDPAYNRAYNPMVNAGALTVTGLVYDHFGAQTDAEILSLFSKLAGGPLSVDEGVYASELSTAYRNKALCYFLRGVERIMDPVEDTLKSYTRQCSINVNVVQLARMAATLANIGRCPGSDESVFSSLNVRNILSIMFTCGMYDFAGRWAVDVGIPAKSGVSGGLIAVVNRQLGIGVFSPRLDEYGNSVRATAACIDLAEELGLHAFEFTNAGSSMLEVYM